MVFKKVCQINLITFLLIKSETPSNIETMDLNIGYFFNLWYLYVSDYVLFISKNTCHNRMACYSIIEQYLTIALKFS